MPQTCVVAVCDSFEIATNAVQLLEDINFPPDQVSLVTHRVQELPLQETAKQISDVAWDLIRLAVVHGGRSGSGTRRVCPIIRS